MVVFYPYPFLGWRGQGCFGHRQTYSDVEEEPFFKANVTVVYADLKNKVNR